MESIKKEEFRASFRRYLNAGKQQKDCKEPCLKNGKSDRYCLECADDIWGSLLPKK
jgi:hypothetical protein